MKGLIWVDASVHRLNFSICLSALYQQQVYEWQCIFDVRNLNTYILNQISKMQPEQILNQEEFDQLMPTLIDAFKTVYNGKSTNISYNDTYSAVYKLCKKGKHSEVINQLKTISQNYFKQMFSQLQANDKILESFETLMTQINEEISRIMEMLLYVETNYYHQCKNQHESLKDLLNFILYKELNTNKIILVEVTKKIAESRIQNNEQKSTNVLTMIMELDAKNQFFTEIFAPTYGPILCKYYSQTSEDSFNKLSLKEYFQFCKTLLIKEKEFLRKFFLCQKTKGQLSTLMLSFYDAIVTTLKPKIYKKDPELLFKNSTCEFLQLLQQREDNTDIEKHNQWFMEQIKQKLQKLETGQNRVFLQNFIKIYHEVSDSLSSLKKFNIRYKAVFFFEDWINEEKIRFPKRLSMYLEEHIIKKLDLTTCMKNFKELFKFLKEKDLFEKIYRTDYAMRMIYFSDSEELENLILKEMEEQCGEQWLDKINRIKNWANVFDSSESSRKNIVLSLPNITLFEDAVWPIYHKKIHAILPKRLHKIEGFEESIQKAAKSLKIKIQLNPFHGTALIQVNFRGWKQEMKVDTCTLSLLLYLEQFGSVSSIKKILQESHYTLDEFKPSIQQLLSHKILSIEGSLSNLDSKLTLEREFSSKSQEILDLTVSHICTQFNIESHAHQEQLQPDRKTMVSALVIKAIKSCKSLTQENLLENVKPMIEARGFMFNKQFVMNIINDLIDRDFMKKTEDGLEYLPV